MAQPAAKAYHRTTVYLTDEQRQWLRRAAAKAPLAGLTVSASDLIRLALSRLQRGRGIGSLAITCSTRRPNGALVLVLDPHGRGVGWRPGRVAAAAGLDRGLLVGRDHELVWPQPLAANRRWYKSSTTPALGKKRLRHLNAVFGAMPRHSAICLFSPPCAAASTIRARSTSRCSALRRRRRASRGRGRLRPPGATQGPVPRTARAPRPEGRPQGRPVVIRPAAGHAGLVAKNR
jgi:hypothetical protein